MRGARGGCRDKAPPLAARSAPPTRNIGHTQRLKSVHICVVKRVRRNSKDEKVG